MCDLHTSLLTPRLNNKSEGHSMQYLLWAFQYIFSHLPILCILLTRCKSEVVGNEITTK